MRRLPLLAALAVALPAAAGAQTNAFSFTGPGNQPWQGALGLDFNVGGTAVQVTRFGAFDDGQDGLTRAISVRLYDRTTQQQVGTTVVLQGTAGTLVGGYRFLDLLTPLTLAPGFQGSIVADGYGAGEQNYNSGGGAGVATNTDGGLVSFVGSARYSTAASVYPTIVDGGPATRYGAGNFTFAAVSTVPEPGTWALLGTGLVALGGVARRRRVRG